MTRAVLVLLLALSVVLAACNSDGQSAERASRVLVGTSVGGQPGLSTQGVPTDDAGLSGVTTAVLTVFRGAEQVYFDAAGTEVEAASGVPIVLTAAESTKTLTLVHGSYSFLVVGSDDGGNDLADGVLENYSVAGEVEVFVPLVSRIGSAVLSAPVVVVPNQIFDVYLTVRPPDRTDLRVPTSDFDAYYGHPGTSQYASSDLGIRLAALCEPIELKADIYRPGGSELVLSTETVHIGVDFTCPTSGGTIGVDLLPPFVSMESPAGGASLPADWNLWVNLSGEVSDLESGVASVVIYEGVRFVGTAVVTPGPDELSMSTWELTEVFYIDEVRPYDLTVIATDVAGNERRATFTINGVAP